MIQETESSSWWHAGPYSVLPTVENMFTALKEEKNRFCMKMFTSQGGKIRFCMN
jgi:hypothetical protein